MHIKNIKDNILKYKLIHWLFWMCYYGLHCQNMYVHSTSGITLYQILFISIFIFVFKIFSVYTILNFLKPKYLSNIKPIKFIFSSLSFLIFMGILNSLMLKAFWGFLLNRPSKHQILSGSISFLFETSLVVIIFLALYFATDFFNERNKNKSLEQENFKAELSFLQGQINPHFLFNAINSIFILIDEDKEAARNHLHTFSEMLRYQLYECRVDAISLQKELQFIAYYISIEIIRKSRNTTITKNINTIQGDKKVVPFLFITFIENAFKHYTNNSVGVSFVDISFTDKDDSLVFICKNTYKENIKKITEKNESNGIGLENTKRRLDLLYPNHHTLLIETENEIYSIILEIKL
jgi:two-component system, LytTR family, sensor kinase